MKFEACLCNMLVCVLFPLHHLFFYLSSLLFCSSFLSFFFRRLKFEIAPSIVSLFMWFCVMSQSSYLMIDSVMRESHVGHRYVP